METKQKKSKSILAKNIAQGRKTLGMNQRDFAEHVGIGESTLKEIESDISPGSHPILTAIAKALGYPNKDHLYRDPSVMDTGSQPTLSDLARIDAKILETLERRLPDNYGEIELELKRTKAELQSIKSSAFWQAYERATPGRRKAVQELLDVVLEEGASRRVKRSHGQEEP